MSTFRPSSPRSVSLSELPVNSWIALTEDENKVIAIGSTYEEAVRKSESAGVSDPLIIKTPGEWLPLSV